MRVIALTSFTEKETGEFHPYGHEFAEPEGERLERWKKEGLVRIDDRNARPKAETPPSVNEG